MAQAEEEIDSHSPGKPVCMCVIIVVVKCSFRLLICAVADAAVSESSCDVLNNIVLPSVTCQQPVSYCCVLLVCVLSCYSV